MSKSIVCTLFEGHYHYGFAGLVNSLHANGFKGDIYAGYRGQLPPWTENKITCNEKFGWSNGQTLQLNDDIKIYFLPVVTRFQFTNYKPEFVMQVAKAIGVNNKNLFYFDPDIVIKCNWKFFEQWVSFGIAVVHEIINNDMPASHPVRQMWNKIIVSNGQAVKRQLTSYLNAGFFGLKSDDLQFLTLYKLFIDVSISKYNIDVEKFVFYSDRSHPFFAKDQDALNLAAMSCEVPISEYGPEAMDFIQGGKVMSHAVGSPKPWKKRFLLSVFQANPPSPAEKEYWKYANGIIDAYPSWKIKYKLLTIKIASFLGRFYRKY